LNPLTNIDSFILRDKFKYIQLPPFSDKDSIIIKNLIEKEKIKDHFIWDLMRVLSCIYSCVVIVECDCKLIVL